MNFKDAYQQDFDNYSSSTSPERLKEYARQEERRRNIEGIPILAFIFLAGLFCWWLFSERDVHISNTYEGIIIEGNSDNIKNPVVKIEGVVTYSSKISNDITHLTLKTTLEDSSGTLIYSNEIDTNVSDSDPTYNFILPLNEIIFEPEHDMYFTGYLFFDKDFKQIMLLCEEEDICFVGPAKTMEEATKIYEYLFPYGDVSR